MSNNYQRAIFQIFKEKTIAYNAGLAKALGSVKAAVLMSQLLFWEGKGRDKEWFYKTIEEIYNETGLSRSEQDTAIKLCKQMGVLKIILKGIPPKRHFKINADQLVKIISKLQETDKTSCKTVVISFAQESQYNSDSTLRNFHRITSEKKNDFKIKKENLIQSMKMEHDPP